MLSRMLSSAARALRCALICCIGSTCAGGATVCCARQERRNKIGELVGGARGVLENGKGGLFRLQRLGALPLCLALRGARLGDGRQAVASQRSDMRSRTSFAFTPSSRRARLCASPAWSTTEKSRRSPFAKYSRARRARRRKPCRCRCCATVPRVRLSASRVDPAALGGADFPKFKRRLCDQARVASGSA